RVDVRVGRARDTLATMAARDDVPFDMAFIDADKAGYPVYLQYVVGLLRPGGLIVADNVVRGGRVLAPEPADEAARGAHAFNEALAAEPRVEATVLQQVGTKGHDGMAIAVVRRRD
ncbi:MAG: O-methyltransferase, partial [Planctomycetota bacterium]